MTTVHNFSENVFQIIIRNLVVFGQIILEHVSTNVEISVIERISTRPSLSAEFLTSQNETVEIAQREKNSLELVRFVGFVDGFLRELGN